MQKISIIVPVYNTQKYLRKCLNSLIQQTYENIEIILINDGSTDQSQEILEEYIKKYPSKIVYYEKENGGIAESRNYGVEKATGEYFCFVDSDDYIDINLLTNLSQYVKEKVDLIKYKLIRMKENDTIIEKVDGPIFHKRKGEDAMNELCFSDTLLDSPCVYLFRRQFWLDHEFKFLPNTYHEDFGLIPLVLLKAESVISTPYYGYYYIQSQKSITRGNDYEKTKKRIQDVFEHYDRMIQTIKDDSISKEAKRNTKIYYTNAILLKLNELKKEDQKDFIKEIKKRNMIKNLKANNVKQLLKKLLLHINIRFYLKLR